MQVTATYEGRVRILEAAVVMALPARQSTPAPRPRGARGYDAAAAKSSSLWSRMNLRRIVEHVRKLDWPAFGIELLVVIVGVFIGLQVSNWNVEREARQRGAMFAERLKADLREEAWYYQLQIEYSRDVLASAERAVDALSGRSDDSNETLLISAYRATQYKQRARRRATYDELVSTGTLGLIKGQTLRNTALQVYNLPTLDIVAREGMQGLQAIANE